MELWLQLPMLFVAGIGVAALNAVAGGGTFFAFPLLVFAGLNPITANATGKFAIWLGALSSIKGYLPEILPQKEALRSVTLIATLGSIAGSLLLLVTPNEVFHAMVPWLMLFATLLFAYGSKIVSALKHAMPAAASHRRIGLLLQWFGMGIIGIYGGFFGAGMGMLVMAFCQLIGMQNIHQTNALKVVVTTGITTLSALVFVLAGLIAWPQAIALGAGTLAGGYAGARFALSLPQKRIRQFVIGYGFAVSAYFFIG
jgi:uncharacterized protein